MTLLSPQLQAFRAVVQYKTVHAAANVLHLTQTAVTQRIRSLEGHLKTTLFLRSRRGMELTREGEALLRYCQSAIDLEGEALAQISGGGLETEREIVIVGPSSIMYSRLLPIATKIKKEYPHLYFQFRFHDSENRHELLRRGECDFAIITQAEISQEMTYKILLPEEYVLVCSHLWKNRSLKSIIEKESIIDFDPSDQMTLNYLKKYDLYDHVKLRRHFTNSTESIANLTIQGLGYTTLTNEYIKDYVNKDKLIILNQGKSYNYQPILAWYPRVELPNYLAGLIHLIK